MQRSGHHAIINWVIRQAEGRICFLNNCRPNSNPLQTHESSESRVCDLDIEAEARGQLSPKDWFIYNFEDCSLGDLPGRLFEANRLRWIGPSGRRIRLVVHRDVFNLFASKLRWAYGRKCRPSFESITRLVNIWKDYARLFLVVGEQSVTANSESAGGQHDCRARLHGDERSSKSTQVDTLLVRYNDWVRDSGYRRQLAQRLGLEFTDAGFNEVAKWGPVTWGDSFDGLDYEGRAQEMKVLERWKNFVDDGFYRRLFRDGELIELSNMVFGEVPGTEILHK